jgi:SAM-dependent methyltransferase
VQNDDLRSDDFFSSFDSALPRQVRAEAYGRDIGQHSWVTAEELVEDVQRLKLARGSRLLDLGCGPAGPLTFVVALTGCNRVAVFREVARVLAAGGRFLYTDGAVVTGSLSDDEIATARRARTHVLHRAGPAFRSPILQARYARTVGGARSALFFASRASISMDGIITPRRVDDATHHLAHSSCTVAHDSVVRLVRAADRRSGARTAIRGPGFPGRFGGRSPHHRRLTACDDAERPPHQSRGPASASQLPRARS